MSERSSASISIDAQPPAVMAVIADFVRYPEWANSIRSTEVTDASGDGRARVVRFVVDAGPIRDEYSLRYDWAPDGHSVTWVLDEPSSMQRSQEGAYLLRPVGPGCEVTYELTVETAKPLLGMLRRKGEKMIMDTALRELKKRVEDA